MKRYILILLLMVQRFAYANDLSLDEISIKLDILSNINDFYIIKIEKVGGNLSISQREIRALSNLPLLTDKTAFPIEIAPKFEVLPKGELLYRVEDNLFPRDMYQVRYNAILNCFAEYFGSQTEENKKDYINIFEDLSYLEKRKEESKNFGIFLKEKFHECQRSDNIEKLIGHDELRNIVVIYLEKRLKEREQYRDDGLDFTHVFFETSYNESSLLIENDAKRRRIEAIKLWAKKLSMMGLGLDQKVYLENSFAILLSKRRVPAIDFILNFLIENQDNLDSIKLIQSKEHHPIKKLSHILESVMLPCLENKDSSFLKSDICHKDNIKNLYFWTNYILQNGDIKFKTLVPFQRATNE